MGLTSWLATATVVFLAATTSRAAPDAGVFEDAPALVEALQSQDASVRAAAAHRIAEQGYDTIEKAARLSAALDDVSWQAFADACIRKKWSPDACALVAAAHAAPDAHRRRLIDLARRLDPEAGTTRTADEMSAIVRKMLVEERGMCSDYFYAAPVAIHGHAGVPAVLELLRENDEETVDYARTLDVLEVIAQPEDVPALRELLLAGKSCVAGALARLQFLGVTEAGDALTHAVLAGRFDERISIALPGGTLDAVAVGVLYDRHAADLSEASYRRRAAEAVRKWAASPDRKVGDTERLWVARSLGDLDSRDDVPTMEAWIASTRSFATRLELGRVLTRLGSRRGIELLVGIAEEKPATDPEKAGSAVAKAPRADVIESWQRQMAIQYLNDVAMAASPTTKFDSRPHRDRGPWGRDRNRNDAIDAVAAEVRAWWDASRDRLTFDAPTGRWRLDPE